MPSRQSISALFSVLLAAGVAAQDFTQVPASQKLFVDMTTGLWQGWSWDVVGSDVTATNPPPSGYGLAASYQFTYKKQWGGAQWHINNSSFVVGSSLINPTGISMNPANWTAFVIFLQGNETLSNLQYQMYQYNWTNPSVTTNQITTVPLTTYTNQTTLSTTTWTQIVIPFNGFSPAPYDTFWIQTMNLNANTTYPYINFAAFLTNATLTGTATTTTTTAVAASPAATSSTKTMAAATSPAMSAAASASPSPSTGVYAGSLKTGNVGYAVMAATMVLVIMAGLL